MSFSLNKKSCILILILLCIISFWPSLFNQFTNWDDHEFVIENPLIQNLSGDSIKAIFTTLFEGVYLPLTILTFAFEHHYFGFNPFIYHLDNLILHSLNVCLVMLIINALTQNLRTAFFVALLFSISPLRVESVAWITERKDVLFSFFFLLSIYAYIRRSSWFSWIFFVLACLAKYQAVSLPFILVVIDYWFKRKDELLFWIEKWPFFLVSIIILFVTLLGVLPIFTNIHLYNYVDKFFLSSFSFITYAVKIFIPYQLSCLYPYPPKINGFFPWWVYMSPALILAWFIIGLRTYKRHPIIMVGGLFFVITILLPLTNVSSGGSLLNDRYTYLPCIGLYWIAASFLTDVLKTRWKPFVVAGVIVYALISSFLTYEGCKIWYNGISLWSDTIRQYPQLAFLYDNRGASYVQKSQEALALEDFSKAIELNPRFASAYNNRAVIYDKQGRKDLALKDFNEAIRQDPSYGVTYFNRSIFYFQQGQLREAYEDALKAQGLGVTVSSSYLQQLNSS